MSACDWSDVWMMKNLEWHIHVCVYIYVYMYICKHVKVLYHLHITLYHLHITCVSFTHQEIGLTYTCVCVYMYIWKYVKILYHLDSTLYHLHIKNLKWHMHMCVCIYIYIYICLYVNMWKFIVIYTALFIIYTSRIWSDIVWVWVKCEWSVSVAHSSLSVVGGWVAAWLPMCTHHFLIITSLSSRIRDDIVWVWAECECCSFFLSDVSRWVGGWIAICACDENHT